MTGDENVDAIDGLVLMDALLLGADLPEDLAAECIEVDPNGPSAFAFETFLIQQVPLVLKVLSVLG
jgi:hypothetical protein